MEGANMQSSSLGATQRSAPAPAEGGDSDRALWLYDRIPGLCAPQAPSKT
jgi:hypothetical protein